MKKAIVIGGEHASWPVKNAVWLSKAGFDVKLLFFSKKRPVDLPDNIGFVHEEIHYSVVDKLLILGWIALSAIMMALNLAHFAKKTGRPPRMRMCLLNNIILAKKRAGVLNRMDADVVIGHNISLSGLTVAFSNIPHKVLIGWGVDFVDVYHSSVLQYKTFEYIVSKTGLFITGCESALNTFQHAFSIESKKLLRCTWADKKLGELLNHPHGQRPEIRARYNIPDEAKIVFNARRFKPLYWGPEGFRACLDIARKRPDVWFVFIEGIANARYARLIHRQLRKESREIASRFILLPGERPFQEMLDLFSISDVFLSLFKKGDMRSATVLQGIAMGVVPVLADNEEWRLLQSQGMEAFIVDPDKRNELVKTILKALDAQKETIAETNRNYIENNESDEFYFLRFSSAINNLVN